MSNNPLRWEQPTVYVNVGQAEYPFTRAQHLNSSGTPSRSVSTPANALRSSTCSTPNTVGDAIRHWTYTGFEWDVTDVHRLRDFIELIRPAEAEGNPAPSPQEVDFDIFKQCPTFGDGKYKLEIVAQHHGEGSEVEDSTADTPSLRLYITSLMTDYQRDCETSASIMVAIKCQEDRAGERGARPDWVWETWQSDWVFRQEREFWECSLPPISSLLQNARIQQTDSFVICVQIHSPIGPSIPRQPSVHYAPRDLLDGLEASLDNPNTGDVRFVCLERMLDQPRQEAGEAPPTPTLHTPFKSYTTARKRVIYAHSDILTRRSEYFATMLSSAFAENNALGAGERKVHTIVVEEADFETMYWLLKYCYANWLLFKQDDDPRIAVEGVGAGWSIRSLTNHMDEWDWKTFRKVGADDSASVTDGRSAASGELEPGSAISRSSSGHSDIAPRLSPHTTTVQARGGATSTLKPVVSPSRPSGPSTPTSSRRPLQGTTSTPASVNTSRPPQASSGSSMAPPRPSKPSASVPTTQGHRPVVGRHQGGGPGGSPDPHPHPTPTPGPASPLAIYQVAHRYVMPSLAALALDHIMSTITPESAFALLLATAVWGELHMLIEDYVVDNWTEVSGSAEFEHCCNEVAAGEWGPEGGKTLMSVFRRLKSPRRFV